MAVQMDGNTSGQGSTAVVPDEIKGWCWGGFLLNWIWSIGNQTYIGLLALVPYAGFIMAIVLGVKGNEWAWQNRKWESVEQFKATQKVWTTWGVVILILSFVIGIIFGVVMPMIMAAGIAASQ